MSTKPIWRLLVRPIARVLYIPACRNIPSLTIPQGMTRVGTVGFTDNEVWLACGRLCLIMCEANCT